MRLPAFFQRKNQLSETIKPAKTITEKTYPSIVEKLVKDTRGIITQPDFTLRAGLVNKDEYIVPHRVNGQRLNWQLYFDVYHNVGIVKNAVNSTANFAVQSGYELEGNKRDVTKVKNWIDRHNFDLKMLNIFKLVQITGNCYIEMPSPDNFKFLPVDQMYVIVKKGGKNDGQITGYIQLTQGNLTNPPRWDPEDIIHFKWNELGTSFYGLPDIRASLTPIKYMLQYLEDIGEIMHRYGHIIYHWKIGDENSPATQQQINDMKALLNNREVGEDLVTSYNVEAVPLVANLRMIQPDGLLKAIENQIISSLEIPDFFVRGGETSNRATSQTLLQYYDRKVRALRETIGQIIEDRIFKEKLRTNVKFAWRELSTEGELNKSTIVRNLSGTQGAGIPATVAMRMVGWGSWVDDYKREWDEELKRQAKLKQALTPPKTQPKQKEPEPKPEDFENDYEYLKAWESYKKRLHG